MVLALAGDSTMRRDFGMGRFVSLLNGSGQAAAEAAIALIDEIAETQGGEEREDPRDREPHALGDIVRVQRAALDRAQDARLIAIDAVEGVCADRAHEFVLGRAR